MQPSPITMNNIGNASGFMNSVQPFTVSPEVSDMVSLHNFNAMQPLLMDTDAR